MFITTNQLSDRALDWAIAQIWAFPLTVMEDGRLLGPLSVGHWHPSTNTKQGADILFQEHIATRPLFDMDSRDRPAAFQGWRADKIALVPSVRIVTATGPTALVAGLRCLVACHYGPRVDVPDYLLAEPFKHDRDSRRRTWDGDMSPDAHLQWLRQLSVGDEVFCTIKQPLTPLGYYLVASIETSTREIRTADDPIRLKSESGWGGVVTGWQLSPARPCYLHPVIDGPDCDIGVLGYAGDAATARDIAWRQFGDAVIGVALIDDGLLENGAQDAKAWIPVLQT